MSTRCFFDCNAVFGPRPNAPRELRTDLASLLDDMDHFGISAALVRHHQAVLHSPPAGNLRLIEAIRGHRERLFPCWFTAPNIVGDLGREVEFGKAMDEHGVRAVELAPVKDNYPVVPEVLSSLATELNARKAVILVAWANLADPYRDGIALGTIFKGCTVILTGIRWANYRMVWAILERVPALCIEMSDFQAYRVIEDFSAHFGPGRLFFGSGAPDHSAGAARGLLDWSLAPPEVVDAVAGGNLCAALGVNPAGLPAPIPAAEPIQAQGRDGAALSNLVIDAHCHLCGEGEHSSGAIIMKGGGCAGQLEISDRCGVDLTAMMSWQAPVAGDMAAGNGLMERCVAEYPDRLLGLSSIDPLQQRLDEMLAAIRPLHEHHCFPGIKPYFPRNGIHYHESDYDGIWSYANEYALYALLHTDESEQATRGVVALAHRFPHVSFLFAHAGGSWNYARLCAEAAVEASNIYCELTLTPVHNGIVEYLVEHAGQDRVLFGTDAPMRDPRPQLGWVVHSRLTTEAKRDVLGRNFLRILEKNGAPGMKAFAPRLCALRALADR